MTRDMDPDLIHQNFLSRQSRFSELKEHFIDISGPHVTGEVLESLKEYYSGIIQSKRDKDRVKNIAGLLRILERRDVLRYDSIEPLKEIAKECIRDRILIETLTCYDAEIKTELPLPAINHYKYSVEGSSQSSSRSQTHAVNFYPNQTSLPVVPYATPSAPTSSGPVSDVQERVFQRLSENLGKYWRDLARFLNVKECEIDAINEKTYLGTKEKAYEALLIFKSRCDSCNWKIKMQQALEKARRKDLAEMINEIMLSDNLF
ncbi:fas-associated death domain protein isoform X3 [Diachasma alloeum]|uniref:fas-associated death domain protein isoform X3 n=1 Tax=Diachasma alloeum TaxID=454923 RepID=UPI0007384AC7|nr:fas-associated death domain protein isoform X3 [Diachasma alloeum]